MDPYINNLKKRAPECEKLPICTRLVVILSSYHENRGLQLIQQSTRAVLANEVHEIIITDKESAEPGSTVDRIAYLGFVEFISGGVLMYGDLVKVNNVEIGKLAGFDYTHMPNHMNIVVKSPKLKSGKEQKIQLRDTLSFVRS